MPNVAMNGATLNRVIINPLIHPKTNPTITLIITINQTIFISLITIMEPKLPT